MHLRGFELETSSLECLGAAAATIKSNCFNDVNAPISLFNRGKQGKLYDN
jgi:hypothetical protein